MDIANGPGPGCQGMAGDWVTQRMMLSYLLVASPSDLHLAGAGKQSSRPEIIYKHRTPPPPTLI